MDIGKILLYGIGAFGIYSIVKGGALQLGDAITGNIDVQKPSIKNFQLTTAGVNTTVDFDLTLPLLNKNNIDIAANSVMGNIRFGGNNVFPVNIGANTLPSNVPIEIVTPVSLKVLDLGLNIFDLVQNPTALLAGMNFQGTVTVNGVPIPVNSSLFS